MFYVKLLIVASCYAFTVNRMSNTQPTVRYFVNTTVTFLLTVYFGWMGLAVAVVVFAYPEEMKKTMEFFFVLVYYAYKRLIN